MKVELKINIDTLVCVNNQLKRTYEYSFPETLEQKLCKSIAYDVADRFDCKTKSQLKKNSLFEAKKLFKITLKYHEAWALKLILIEQITEVNNDYQKTLLQKVINNLDQKLK